MRSGCMGESRGKPGDKVFARSSDAFMAVGERVSKYLRLGGVERIVVSVVQSGMMVVEDKEGMALDTGGARLFHRLFPTKPEHDGSTWLDTIKFYSDF